MPDIFRAMQGKSDTQILEELHYFVQAMWLKQGKQPVHSTRIAHFLAQRLPSDKIEKLMLVAERAGFLSKSPDKTDHWLPRPRHLHGVE